MLLDIVAEESCGYFDESLIQKWIIDKTNWKQTDWMLIRTKVVFLSIIFGNKK